ncbi:MAG: hypothetical protein DDT23_00026 [candidate division WS2 bacterium]|nr:hypothetical protein [Candidatus Lithacetigena glycinireducens]
MSIRIRVRRGPKARLPVLGAGEFGFTTDTKEVFIGDGTANHELEMTARKGAPSGYAALNAASLVVQNPASATVTAAPNSIVLRDAFGRSKIAAPAAADDIAQRAQADAVQTNLDIHSSLTIAHGAVSAAMAGRIVVRDANARASFAAPSAAGDVAILSTVTDHAAATTGVHGVGTSVVESVAGAQSKVDIHGALTAPHGATDAAIAGRLVLRDAAGRAKFAAPAAAGDALIRGARLTAAEMPDGPIGLVLTGRGPGVNPVYEAADYPRNLKPAIVRWALPGWSGGSRDGVCTANVIYYIPIFVSETTTYIRVGLWVLVASAGTIDIRIFSWRDGVPHSLILSAGTVDTGTTGPKEIIISQVLTRGYYFLAYRCTGTPICVGFSDDARTPAAIMRKLGWGTTESVLTVMAAYADPAPAPTDIARNMFAVLVLREN